MYNNFKGDIHMKKKKTLLSVVSALILSLSIVGAASANSSVPHHERAESTGGNECIQAGKCIRP